MIPKVLTDLDFSRIVLEGAAQTAVGSDLLSKYQTYVLNNAVSCSVVNNFIKESAACSYDNGISYIRDMVTDYVGSNRTLWAIATACESIANSRASYNMLNRYAADQAAKLLEMDEESCRRYIKAGGMKDIMFCENFRNVAKDVFRDNKEVTIAEEYTATTPQVYTEKTSNGRCFRLFGHLYQLNEDKTLATDVEERPSNTFFMISDLLDAPFCTIEEDNVVVKYDNYTYTIPEKDKVMIQSVSESKTINPAQLREHNAMILRATNPRMTHQVAAVLEAVALACENYDNICDLDIAKVYTTKNDKFFVIESSDSLYAKSLQSTHDRVGWEIMESAPKALNIIQSKTKVEIAENYANAVDKSIANVSEQEKEDVKKNIMESQVQSIRERIGQLTNKFKDDPVKLALLAKLGEDL